MKTVISILALFVLSITTLHATVYTVDNNVSHPTPYQDIQSAIDIASAGDTIYVQGSGTVYPSFNITKKLVIIGTGPNPQKENPMVSTVRTFSIDTGASGSSIMGLYDWCYQCSSGLITFPHGSVDNITIYGCLFIDGNGPNAHIRGNNWYLSNNIFCNGLVPDTIISSMNCENNVFTGMGLYTDYNLYFASLAIIIRNNLFLQNSFGGDAFVVSYNGYSVSGATVENNIFFGTDPSKCNGCVFNNNISYLGNNNVMPPPTCSGANNFSNTDPLFVNAPLPSNDFYGFDYHLQTTSPGYNAGTDGTDIGIYGGSSPFIFGGEPAIPQIKSLNIYNTTVPVGGMLQFNAASKK